VAAKCVEMKRNFHALSEFKIFKRITENSINNRHILKFVIPVRVDIVFSCQGRQKTPSYTTALINE
jgi:hypothetical protein